LSELIYYHLNGRTKKVETETFDGSLEELIKDTETMGAFFNGETLPLSRFTQAPHGAVVRVFECRKWNWFKLIPNSLFPTPLTMTNHDQALSLVRTMLNSGKDTGSIDTGDLLADLETVKRLLEGGTNVRSH
jgi:hypothetical protein